MGFNDKESMGIPILPKERLKTGRKPDFVFAPLGRKSCKDEVTVKPEPGSGDVDFPLILPGPPKPPQDALNPQDSGNR